MTGAGAAAVGSQPEHHPGEVVRLDRSRQALLKGEFGEFSSRHCDRCCFEPDEAFAELGGVERAVIGCRGIADENAGNTSAMNSSAFNNDTLEGVRNSWDTVRGQIQVRFPGLSTQDLPRSPADLDTLIDTIVQCTGQNHEQVRQTLRGLFQQVSNRPAASQSPGSA